MHWLPSFGNCAAKVQALLLPHLPAMAHTGIAAHTAAVLLCCCSALLAPDVIARVEAALGGKLDSPAHIHNVRDVAPGKLMLCVTFKVPAAVAFAGRLCEPTMAATATPAAAEAESKQHQEQQYGDADGIEPDRKRVKAE